MKKKRKEKRKDPRGVGLRICKRMGVDNPTFGIIDKNNGVHKINGYLLPKGVSWEEMQHVYAEIGLELKPRRAIFLHNGGECADGFEYL